MKLPQNYLKLISGHTQGNDHLEAMKMTALALMSFGGRTLGGNYFNALRESYEGYLIDNGDDDKLLEIAKCLLTGDSYAELMEVLGLK